MSVSSATSTTATDTTATTSSAGKEAQKQKDQFLQILMTQLQNQNPLDPQKPEQFAAQLAQYSQLEQQINTNDKLDSLLTQLGKANVSPLSYLGTTIDFTSDVAPVQGEQATWNYDATGAEDITLTIKDLAGNVIYTGEGDPSAGSHALTLTSLAGVPDGTPLTLSVTARNAEGVSVPATITARARIDAVSTKDGVTSLEAGGYAIDTALVKRIATSQTASSGTTDTEDNS